MLSDKAKEALDDVIAKAGDEGHTIWGFVLNRDGSELQAFGNSGDEIATWIHNVDTALAAMRENLKQEQHEA